MQSDLQCISAWMQMRPGILRMQSLSSRDASQLTYSISSNPWRLMTLQGCALFIRRYQSRLRLTKQYTAWRALVAYLIARLLISLLSSLSLLVDYVLDNRLSRRQQSGAYIALLQV